MDATDVSLGMLYESALREARDEALQELDPDFYRSVSEYLGRLGHEEYDGVEAAVKKAVVSRAALMLSLLLETRLEKAAARLRRRGGAAGEGAAGEGAAGASGGGAQGATPGGGGAAGAAGARGNLLDEEKYVLYPGTDMDERRALVLDGILAGRTRLLESVTAAHRSRLVTVRIIKQVDEMVGADLSRYGPYSAEDIATVPLENAAALVGQGLAVRAGVD